MNSVKRSRKDIKWRRETGDTDKCEDQLKNLEEEGFKGLMNMINNINMTVKWPEVFWVERWLMNRPNSWGNGDDIEVEPTMSKIINYWRYILMPRADRDLHHNFLVQNIETRLNEIRKLWQIKRWRDTEEDWRMKK